MANTKSAKKQILITARNNARNVRYRTMLKTSLKRVRTAISDGTDAAAAQAAVNEAVRALYRSVTRGIIHRGNAKRRVGRIMKAYERRFNSETAQS